MNKINFKNNITKVNAETFNTFQNNIENAINGTSSVIELTTTVESNTNYTIPLNYHVGANDLVILYCGEKLIKGIDYIEVGEAGAVSNIVQFTSNLGDLNMSSVSGFENFVETLEFIVRGDYSDNT